MEDFSSKNMSSKIILRTKPTGKRGIRSLGHALDIITKPIFLKRGFASSRIISDWHKIVGDAVAVHSIPRRLTFPKDKQSGGTLYVEISNSGFATQMVYLEPMILEKISCYFGYRAVKHLKILQNPKAQPALPQKPAVVKQLSQVNSAALESAIAGITDEGLKESLRSLGRGILSE